jgi:hypothetical protein
MRLTLRTLLAYLDDTLEPSEIKQIGQKVAESDAAQELIARLKQVTRRRRLTTPSDTGQGEPFDPNSVAAYLDNELPSEQVAELERLCLESDVHLAEVAACHQILTLVLGEPALVPPTAKERMYGLVKGREAIPFRKATTPTAAGGDDAEETDDAMMSVLAFHRQQNGWKRWIAPAAGVLLFLALPIVLYVALSQNTHTPRDTRPVIVASSDKTNPDKDAAKDADASRDKSRDADTKDKSEKDTTASPKDKDKSTVVTPPADKPDKDKSAKDAPVGKDKSAKEGNNTAEKVVDWPTEPSPERREVAVYQGSPKAGTPSILVQHSNDDKVWKRLSPNSPINSSDPLVSLPGYPSEITTPGGVRLQMWGTLTEFLPQGLPPLSESAAILHSNPRYDLELTLERGRIFLANVKGKGPVRIRLRFDTEIWDIALLEPDTEIGVDLFKMLPTSVDWRSQQPRADIVATLLRGKAELQLQYNKFENLQMPGPGFFRWDSYGPGITGPLPQQAPSPAFSKEVPAGKDIAKVREALEAISRRMGEKKAVNVILKEIATADDSPELQRLLSIQCLGALDAIPTVLDILDGKDDARARDRHMAIIVLARWVGRSLENSMQLFDIKDRKSGILLDKKYTPNESAIVVSLLHDFDEVRLQQPETYVTLADYLTSNKMAIRELAYFHLVHLSTGLKSIPPYNAAWDPERRSTAAGQWKELAKDLVKRSEQPAGRSGSSGSPPK